MRWMHPAGRSELNMRVLTIDFTKKSASASSVCGINTLAIRQR